MLLPCHISSHSPPACSLVQFLYPLPLVCALCSFFYHCPGWNTIPSTIIRRVIPHSHPQAHDERVITWLFSHWYIPASVSTWLICQSFWPWPTTCKDVWGLAYPQTAVQWPCWSWLWHVCWDFCHAEDVPVIVRHPQVMFSSCCPLSWLTSITGASLGPRAGTLLQINSLDQTSKNSPTAWYAFLTLRPYALYFPSVHFSFCWFLGPVQATIMGHIGGNARIGHVVLVARFSTLVRYLCSMTCSLSGSVCVCASQQHCNRTESYPICLAMNIQCASFEVLH